MDNSELIILFLNLLLPLGMLFAAAMIGHLIESRHLRRLETAEAELDSIMLVQLKSLPPGWTTDGTPEVLSASVVLANDYFRIFLAAWRMVFGGRVRSFERLMERARREALVRLRREARDKGFNVVWNLRVETTMMQTFDKRQSGSVEIVAYGTGMRVKS